MTTATAGALTARRPAGSVADLVSGASRREPLVAADGKSGSTLERVVIDGKAYVLKQMHPDQDWIARTLGDLCCWPVRLWTTGFLDLIPRSIDHTVVGAVEGLGRNGWGGALLMEDVTPWLIPEGDDVVPLDVHLSFFDHMAEMHACFWGFTDTLGLLSLETRYRFFCPETLEVEAGLGWPQVVPRIAADGWDRFVRRPGRTEKAVMDLVRDPSPLIEALTTTPQTFIQGDWKMGNLGRHPDGRTILLDWAYPGEGPATADLAWYLALNTARLPHSKEEAIAAYRGALESHGVPTVDWFEPQLALASLGALVWFGWEKALGDDAELEWWLECAGRGLDLL